MNSSPCVILFGAGASKYSGGLNTQPPLGNELIEKLAERFPDTWGDRWGIKIESFIPDFEKGMTELIRVMDRSGGDYSQYLRDLARFFSQFKIENPSENYYYKLITDIMPIIKQERIVLSSLNYDCILEDAINQFIPIYKINPFTNPIGPMVIKPHGSCNYFIEMSNIHITERAMTTGSSAKINGTPICVDRMDVDQYCKPNMFPPILSLYDVYKTTMSGNNVISAIRKHLALILHNAPQIAIVGVKPIDHDVHIWTPLKEARGNLIMVNPDSDGMCEEWLQKYRRGKKDRLINKGFKDSISEISRALYTSILPSG